MVAGPDAAPVLIVGGGIMRFAGLVSCGLALRRLQAPALPVVVLEREAGRGSRPQVCSP